jgi:HSP20 family protein
MNMLKLVSPTRDRNTAVTRPSNEGSIYSLHREMDRLFDDFFRTFETPVRNGIRQQWPSVEVREADTEFKVIAELPGIDEKDVEVTLEDGVLMLKGEKRMEQEGALYSERWSGSFERQIPFNEDVDAEKVNASFKKGVLTVTLPKKAEAQRQVRRIAIS